MFILSLYMIVFSKWREFKWFAASELFLSCDANMDLTLKSVVMLFFFLKNTFVSKAMSVSMYYLLTVFMNIYIYSFYV